VSGWEPLLTVVASGPRENGTPALHAAADALAALLRRAGAEVELFTFDARPWRLRVAGIVVLLGALLYRRLVLRGRRVAALAVALLVPAILVADVDFDVPLLAPVPRAVQQDVVARLPATAATQTLVLGAHYDTKTDALDHVQRAVVQAAVVPVLAVMVAGALLAPRRARLVGAIAVLEGAAFAVALSAGALLPRRSAGAVDDGAACAVLVRLVERLAAEPRLARTEVQVVLFSGEEIGMQGSTAWARAPFAGPPARPTAFVNLDPIGTSPELAVLGAETYVTGRLRPDPLLVALLDDVHRATRGTPLPRTWYGGGTDARSLLARGIPAATLVAAEPGRLFPRGLHTARDTAARLDPAALDATLDYLLAAVHAVDARGLPATRAGAAAGGALAMAGP
jgi:acetylornithine deacetylase/succinyl-diaminopimelate desuccinylase-like protein